jgi:hypothetical protein
LLLVLVPIAIRNYQISGFVAPLGFNLPHAINVQSGYMGVQFRVNYEKDLKGQTFFRNPSNVSLINPLQKHGLETELHLLGYPMDLEQSSLGPSFREVAPFHEPTCKLFTLDWKEDWLRIYQEHKARGWQGFLVWLDNMRFFFVGLPNPEYRLRVPFFDAWTVWMSHNYVWPIAFGLCCLGNLVYFQRQRRLPYIAILAMVGWFCCIFSDIVSESRYHKPLEIFLVINAMWLFLRRQELALPRFRWRLPGPEKLPD